MHVFREFDDDAGAMDSVLTGPFGGNRIALQAELTELPGQVTERQPGIDQGAEDHVATGTGKRIEVRNLHHIVSFLGRRGLPHEPP
jgi:hypothetical protein